jgi:UDP-N-acetyl-D-mannosaminuronic acid dehydrogenase
MAEQAAELPVPTADPLDMVVVGGCGHVGLPLAMAFANAGLSVGIQDIDELQMQRIRSGEMPFMERGGPELLSSLLPTGRLQFSTDVSMLGRTQVVVLVIGTPIDKFMNPSMKLFEQVVSDLIGELADGSLLILRSTVYPGTTKYVERRLREAKVDAEVVFCPERIAEGYALEELGSLSQLIGASSDEGYERAAAVFAALQVEMIRTTPDEAELAKLLTNAWRYMKFAIANQFFQISHSAGIDYNNVLHAVRHRYPRAADLPAPGFAAGPCLLKDTMQLAAFSPDHFPMGHSAMLVNEGLPGYLLDALDRRSPLAGRTIGILGMAFKGESDDNRTSLSYKLHKLAEFKGATVLCTDPYVADPSLAPLEEVLNAAEILIIGAPHNAYRDLSYEGYELVDIWGLTGRGITL